MPNEQNERQANVARRICMSISAVAILAAQLMTCQTDVAGWEAAWQGGERYKMQNSSPQREQVPTWLHDVIIR
jgi:hypothetical protein